MQANPQASECLSIGYVPLRAWCLRLGREVRVSARRIPLAEGSNSLPSLRPHERRASPGHGWPSYYNPRRQKKFWLHSNRRLVEARHVEDSTGYPCERTAKHECDDCGAAICDLHAELCALCGGVFLRLVLVPAHEGAARQTSGSNPRREDSEALCLSGSLTCFSQRTTMLILYGVRFRR